MTDDAFADLLAANRQYSDAFSLQGIPGTARAKVAVVTCMDCRIDPLAIMGLQAGDAKIVRNPGGQINADAIEALVLSVHLLGVDKIMVVPHTRCAMSSSTEASFQERVSASAGLDAAWQPFHVVPDQEAELRRGVERVRSHPLIPDTVAVGGFRYDVDSGLLERLV